MDIILPTRIHRSDPHTQQIPLLGLLQYPIVLNDGPVPDESPSSVNVPYHLDPHNLITSLPVIQSEFEPSPAALPSPMCRGVTTPPLIPRVRRDDHPPEREREFPTLDGWGLEVSHVGVTEVSGVGAKYL